MTLSSRPSSPNSSTPASSASASSSPIDYLPRDLKSLVFSFLNVFERLRARHVCHSFSDCCAHPLTWQHTDLDTIRLQDDELLSLVKYWQKGKCIPQTLDNLYTGNLTADGLLALCSLGAHLTSLDIRVLGQQQSCPQQFHRLLSSLPLLSCLSLSACKLQDCCLPVMPQLRSLTLVQSEVAGFKGIGVQPALSTLKIVDCSGGSHLVSFVLLLLLCLSLFLSFVLCFTPRFRNTCFTLLYVASLSFQK